MKIAVSYPPNIKEIYKVFPIEGKKGIVFTYGDTIYNPDNGYIDGPLAIHEATHFIQQTIQGMNPETWWKKYLVDKKFRLIQEIEAYRNQYRSYTKLENDRNLRYRFIHRIAKDLSSDQYGSIISFNEALRIIKI